MNPTEFAIMHSRKGMRRNIIRNNMIIPCPWSYDRNKYGLMTITQQSFRYFYNQHAVEVAINGLQQNIILSRKYRSVPVKDLVRGCIPRMSIYEHHMGNLKSLFPHVPHEYLEQTLEYCDNSLLGCTTFLNEFSKFLEVREMRVNETEGRNRVGPHFPRDVIVFPGPRCDIQFQLAINHFRQTMLSCLPHLPISNSTPRALNLFVTDTLCSLRSFKRRANEPHTQSKPKRLKRNHNIRKRDVPPPSVSLKKNLSFFVKSNSCNGDINFNESFQPSSSHMLENLTPAHQYNCSILQEETNRSLPQLLATLPPDSHIEIRPTILVPQNPTHQPINLSFRSNYNLNTVNYTNMPFMSQCNFFSQENAMFSSPLNSCLPEKPDIANNRIFHRNVEPSEIKSPGIKNFSIDDILSTNPQQKHNPIITNSENYSANANIINYALRENAGPPSQNSKSSVKIISVHNISSNIDDTNILNPVGPPNTFQDVDPMKSYFPENVTSTYSTQCSTVIRNSASVDEFNYIPPEVHNPVVMQPENLSFAVDSINCSCQPNTPPSSSLNNEIMKLIADDKFNNDLVQADSNIFEIPESLYPVVDLIEGNITDKVTSSSTPINADAPQRFDKPKIDVEKANKPVSTNYANNSNDLGPPVQQLYNDVSDTSYFKLNEDNVQTYNNISINSQNFSIGAVSSEYSFQNNVASMSTPINSDVIKEIPENKLRLKQSHINNLDIGQLHTTSYASKAIKRSCQDIDASYQPKIDEINNSVTDDKLKNNIIISYVLKGNKRFCVENNASYTSTSMSDNEINVISSSVNKFENNVGLEQKFGQTNNNPEVEPINQMPKEITSCKSKRDIEIYSIFVNGLESQPLQMSNNPIDESINQSLSENVIPCSSKSMPDLENTSIFIDKIYKRGTGVNNDCIFEPIEEAPKYNTTFTKSKSDLGKSSTFIDKLEAEIILTNNNPTVIPVQQSPEENVTSCILKSDLGKSTTFVEKFKKKVVFSNNNSIIEPLNQFSKDNTTSTKSTSSLGMPKKKAALTNISSIDESIHHHPLEENFTCSVKSKSDVGNLSVSIEKIERETAITKNISTVKAINQSPNKNTTSYKSKSDLKKSVDKLKKKSAQNKNYSAVTPTNRLRKETTIRASKLKHDVGKSTRSVGNPLFKSINQSTKENVYCDSEESLISIDRAEKKEAKKNNISTVKANAQLPNENTSSLKSKSDIGKSSTSLDKLEKKVETTKNNSADTTPFTQLRKENITYLSKSKFDLENTSMFLNQIEKNRTGVNNACIVKPINCEPKVNTTYIKSKSDLENLSISVVLLEKNAAPILNNLTVKPVKQSLKEDVTNCKQTDLGKSSVSLDKLKEKVAQKINCSEDIQVKRLRREHGICVFKSKSDLEKPFTSVDRLEKNATQKNNISTVEPSDKLPKENETSDAIDSFTSDDVHENNSQQANEYNSPNTFSSADSNKGFVQKSIVIPSTTNFTEVKTFLPDKQQKMYFKQIKKLRSCRRLSEKRNTENVTNNSPEANYTNNCPNEELIKLSILNYLHEKNIVLGDKINNNHQQRDKHKEVNTSNVSSTVDTIIEEIENNSSSKSKYIPHVELKCSPKQTEQNVVKYPNISSNFTSADKSNTTFSSSTLINCNNMERVVTDIEHEQNVLQNHSILTDNQCENLITSEKKSKNKYFADKNSTFGDSEKCVKKIDLIKKHNTSSKSNYLPHVELKCSSEQTEENIIQSPNISSNSIALEARNTDISSPYMQINCNNMKSVVTDIEQQANVLQNYSASFDDSCEILLNTVASPKNKYLENDKEQIVNAKTFIKKTPLINKNNSSSKSNFISHSELKCSSEQTEENVAKSPNISSKYISNIDTRNTPSSSSLSINFIDLECVVIDNEHQRNVLQNYFDSTDGENFLNTESASQNTYLEVENTYPTTVNNKICLKKSSLFKKNYPSNNSNFVKRDGLKSSPEKNAENVVKYPNISVNSNAVDASNAASSSTSIIIINDKEIIVSDNEFDEDILQNDISVDGDCGNLKCTKISQNNIYLQSGKGKALANGKKSIKKSSLIKKNSNIFKSNILTHDAFKCNAEKTEENVVKHPNISIHSMAIDYSNTTSPSTPIIIINDKEIIVTDNELDENILPNDHIPFVEMCDANVMSKKGSLNNKYLQEEKKKELVNDKKSIKKSSLIKKNYPSSKSSPLSYDELKRNPEKTEENVMKHSNSNSSEIVTCNITFPSTSTIIINDKEVIVCDNELEENMLQDGPIPVEQCDENLISTKESQNNKYLQDEKGKTLVNDKRLIKKSSFVKKNNPSSKPKVLVREELKCSLEKNKEYVVKDPNISSNASVIDNSNTTFSSTSIIKINDKEVIVSDNEFVKNISQNGSIPVDEQCDNNLTSTKRSQNNKNLQVGRGKTLLNGKKCIKKSHPIKKNDSFSKSNVLSHNELKCNQEKTEENVNYQNNSNKSIAVDKRHSISSSTSIIINDVEIIVTDNELDKNILQNDHIPASDNSENLINGKRSHKNKYLEDEKLNSLDNGNNSINKAPIKNTNCSPEVIKESFRSVLKDNNLHYSKSIAKELRTSTLQQDIDTTFVSPIERIEKAPVNTSRFNSNRDFRKISQNNCLEIEVTKRCQSVNGTATTYSKAEKILPTFENYVWNIKFKKCENDRIIISQINDSDSTHVSSPREFDTTIKNEVVEVESVTDIDESDVQSVISRISNKSERVINSEPDVNTINSNRKSLNNVPLNVNNVRKELFTQSPTCKNKASKSPTPLPMNPLLPSKKSSIIKTKIDYNKSIVDSSKTNSARKSFPSLPIKPLPTKQDMVPINNACGKKLNELDLNKRMSKNSNNNNNNDNSKQNKGQRNVTNSKETAIQRNTLACARKKVRNCSSKENLAASKGLANSQNFSVNNKNDDRCNGQRDSCIVSNNSELLRKRLEETCKINKYHTQKHLDNPKLNMIPVVKLVHLDIKPVAFLNGDAENMFIEIIDLTGEPDDDEMKKIGIVLKKCTNSRTEYRAFLLK